MPEVSNAFSIKVDGNNIALSCISSRFHLMYLRINTVVIIHRVHSDAFIKLFFNDMTKISNYSAQLLFLFIIY